MSKKLFFLMSFVLVIGLNSTVQAGPIDVNNYSFEYDVNSNQITKQIGFDNVKGWTPRDTTGWGMGWNFAGVGENFEGFEAVDGNVASFQVTSDDPNDPNSTCQIFQILEDANAIIAENQRYTLTFNALRCNVTETPIAYGALFYSLGGVNVPPANDVILASKKALLTLPSWDEPGYAGWEEIKVTYTALSGADSIGERLGVKLSVPVPWYEGMWVAMDNVRVESSWASDAWDPDPADKGKDVPRSATLSWLPGVWAATHDVYFGTSESEVADANTSSDPNIYRGSGSVAGPDANNRFSYAVPETLELGKTYYWRIDEVNDAYSGTEPPPGPWKGAVWSFEATGKAYNVYPADGAAGIPAMELTLRWEAGTDAGSHDVYLGSSYSAVRDANTNTSGIFRQSQALSDVNYLVPQDLDVHEDYYWRIDEVNSTTGTFVKGDVWSFRTGAFLVVDSFDFYENDAGIKAVWKDYWSNPASKNGAEVFVETDPNFIRSGRSMEYTYKNFATSGGKYVGSWAEADATDLEFASNDWTRGGVKALVMYMYGDPCNAKDTTWVFNNVNQDQMYVALEDGSATEGLVKYPDMNDIKEDFWHEWNVSLQDFGDAGVVLSNVSKVYLGFGGYDKVGQTKAGAGKDYGYADTVYFEDIRLYPPRCMTEIIGLDVLHGLGDITEDCNTDYFDLDIMAGDWLMSGQWVEAQPPTFAPEVWYRFDDGPGKTVVKNDGWWGSQYDIAVSSPNAVDEPKWTTDAAPALDPCDPNYALDFDGADDYLEIPNSPATNFAGTQNMTITTWVKGTPTAWSHLVCSATDDPRHATGLGFGGTDGDFMYFWNENEWWWDPGFVVPDNQWAFMAIAVEPTQATAYLYDGTTFKQAKNAVGHGPLEDFDADCFTVIAQDAQDSGYFDGMMDDVRLYNKTLTAGEIMGIAGAEGFVYVPLDSDADLVVGDKEPTDPCAPIDDQIDFADYAAFAAHWLEQHPWP